MSVLLSMTTTVTPAAADGGLRMNKRKRRIAIPMRRLYRAEDECPGYAASQRSVMSDEVAAAFLTNDR